MGCAFPARRQTGGRIMANPFSLEALLRLRDCSRTTRRPRYSVSRTRASRDGRRGSARKFACQADRNDRNGRLQRVDELDPAARSSTASTLAELDALEAEWQLRMEDARQKYAAAKADAASLEKLEERHILATTNEENRKEQLSLDEIAARSWHLANGKAL